MNIPCEEHSVTISGVATAASAASARIHTEIYQTPLIPAARSGEETDSNVLFKAENFQITGSFKLRGATNKLKYMREINPDSSLPLVTASSGNHGIACAHAASKLKQKFIIVLPENVSPLKLERIQAYGIETILHGDETGKAETHARNLAVNNGYTYVSPYNDPEVIAGQGTIGIEIIAAMQDRPIDNIFIAMGGGGLISGIGSVIKHLSPQTKIWGVAAKNSDALAASLSAGKVIKVNHLPTLADGVSGGMDTDSITFPLAQQVVDEVVTCTETEIESAFIKLALLEHQIVEGSAALALAALYQVAHQCTGKNNVVVLCASNISQQLIWQTLNKARSLSGIQ